MRPLRNAATIKPTGNWKNREPRHFQDPWTCCAPSAVLHCPGLPHRNRPRKNRPYKTKPIGRNQPQPPPVAPFASRSATSRSGFEVGLRVNAVLAMFRERRRLQGKHRPHIPDAHPAEARGSTLSQSAPGPNRARSGDALGRHETPAIGGDGSRPLLLRRPKSARQG